MITGSGGLVFDRTCGSGSTAYVAVRLWRRWFRCDKRRVALSRARQRIMIVRYPYFKYREFVSDDLRRNPDGAWLSQPDSVTATKRTIRCARVPHLTLRSVAQNTALDPIFNKHRPRLLQALTTLNSALKLVTPETRRRLEAKSSEA